MLENQLARIAMGVVAVGLGCASPPPEGEQVRPASTEGRGSDDPNHSFAVYDGSSQLASRPIEDLRLRMRSPGPGISDIYLVAHGLNYTIPNAVAAYGQIAELVEQQLDPALRGAFRPFFIFLAWPSAFRPAGAATGSIPSGPLETLVAPLVGGIDEWVFRAPSSWAVSLDAYSVALGTRPPDEYHGWDYDDVLPPRRADQGARDLPVSALIYELLRMRESGKVESRSIRIHLVGHSYGSKILVLAAIEALRRFALEEGVAPADLPRDPIETLILFTPAFQPGELFYASSFSAPAGRPMLLSTEVIASALRSIPRKAIVYSRFDYPGGPLFALSQLLLNSRGLQKGQAALDHLVGRIGGRGEEISALGVIVSPVAGIAQLGWSLARSPVEAALITAANLLPDLVYHVRINDTFDALGGAHLGWLRPALNAAHFFVPLDELLNPHGRPDQLGLFRGPGSAIGSAGLSYLAAGRPDLGKWIHSSLDRIDTLGPLDRFAPPEAKRDSAAFVQLSRAAGAIDPGARVEREAILSFDATRVATRWIPPEGAHSDLASRDLIDLGDGPQEKRVHTFNFIFNFTLCLPTETSRPRAFCRFAPANAAQGAAEPERGQTIRAARASS